MKDIIFLRRKVIPSFTFLAALMTFSTKLQERALSLLPFLHFSMRFFMRFFSLDGKVQSCCIMPLSVEYTDRNAC